MNIKTVQMGHLGENCYIIEDTASGEIAVVDPGLCNEELKSCLPKPERVRYILLTHRHFDHVNGAAELKGLTGAQIVIHKEDECGITRPKAGIGGGCPRPVRADILLEGGEEITLGKLRFQVLHTPGHSRGGVCYITGDVIFSGDTLFYGDIGRLDLPSGNYQDMINSLQALSDLPGDYKVYPGHGEPTTLEFERRNNRYFGKTSYDDFLI